MSKFFYKGRLEKKQAHSSPGFETNATVRLGTEKAPAQITVSSDARLKEVQALCDEHHWVADISVEEGAEESLHDLETLQASLNTEQAVTTKQAGRNDPCPCGSGKKYKKCCAS